MDGNRIRSVFLKFFEDRDHVVVPGSSLVPVDPTLLLTSAGMVQFKPYFLGEEPAPYPKATSVQRCARTSDIDVVGTTASHFTFFEMLGNFSFGDYFKEKAIPWAHELVTDGLGIDDGLLWFTIYEDDEEAAGIWIDGVGVRPERVQRGGIDQGTFWQMGVPGPCGPSSEIFVDRGPGYGPEGGPIGGGEDRFVELWNLVFMQHVQDEPYHVVGDLPSKNIDTGMGLERAAMVLQDAASAFETDLVRPVLAATERVTGIQYGAEATSDVSLRILADHGRALTFLIGDGVVPSNEGRGYVLRRLLRRAVRHAWSLGSEDLVTPALVDATVGVMDDAYPELSGERDRIVEIAKREERRFRKTLEAGYSLLEVELEGLADGAEVSGGTAFKLHDTFGFPVELTEEIAAERGVGIDLSTFGEMMREQRERARAARTDGGGDAAAAAFYRALLDDLGPTEFVGHEHEEARGRILGIVRDGEALERAEEGDRIEVFVDRTPFYAESGGQVGDTGVVETETGRLRIVDTQFPVPSLHGHWATVESGFVQVGQDAASSVAAERRERIRKSHTGTHLLHWALRDVLGRHVHQGGSLVEAGRLRFDFSHHSALSDQELWEVERAANERIIENARIRAFETSRQEADKIGALAWFGEKYGERVRVVEAGEYSRELCGGTHVPSTGQVGPLVVVSESSIGSNLRRVGAYTGSVGYQHLTTLRRRLRQTAESLRVQEARVAEAAGALAARVREQEARIEAFEERSRSQEAASLLDQAERLDGKELVVAARKDLSPDDLRALALQVRQRLSKGVAVLGAESEGKAALVAVVTSDLVAEGVSAAAILEPAARIVGGGGSKDPELSQAGGPRGENLDGALEEAKAAARAALERL
ncbi:MAG: alanine--tRNA ligase [Acidimicrobiia bacterium]